MTLIRNLEVYGLDPAVVATALQHRVQASTVLQSVPGAKDKVLVQIQGNQTQQVASLLLGTELDKINCYRCLSECLDSFQLSLIAFSDYYRIPRKYIQGLDKAPKPGKKK